MKAIPATIRRFPLVVALVTAALVIVSAVALAAEEGFFSVRPRAFDPHHTFLVNASWQTGIGCPTDAKVVLFNSNPPYNLLPPSRYSDPACLTGDPSDRTNQGLLLAKTGPTLNDAAAVADLVGVKGEFVTELGYDIRKPGAETSLGPSGSHCGAGAPRFDVTLEDGQSFFIGCNSPPATTQIPGQGWIRLRWGGSLGPLQGYSNGVLTAVPTNVRVKSIQIVFDEGQDTGPDFFGLAVLDNIDVNGVLVGHGGNRNDGGGDNGNGGGNN